MMKAKRKFLPLLLMITLICSLTVQSYYSNNSKADSNDYIKTVTKTSHDSILIDFESLCSSTYVYLHYQVDNGTDYHYLMNQSGNNWTRSISQLNSNSIVEYWFTYQIGTTQKDTQRFTYSMSDTPVTSVPTSAPTTPPVSQDDYSYSATYVNAASSLITFTSNCSSTYVYLHYKVNGGMDYHYLMDQNADVWTRTISGLSENDTVTYYFTYQYQDTQKDTTPWGYHYIHTPGSLPTVTPTPEPTTVPTITPVPTTPPDPSSAKYEPADGKCLVVIGQCKEDMYDYAALSDLPDPAGYMFYTATVDAAGMTGPSNKGAGTIDLPYWSSNYNHTIAQIGIDMTDYDGHQPGADEEVAVAAGLRDDNIRTIARAVKATNKPVYVRIGYEADSPWNHYETWNYIKAYRRVHDIFREEQVANAAFVWSLVGTSNAAGPAPYYESMAIESWYPGDAYVDWISVSFFGWETAGEEARATSARIAAAEFAAAHNKPLMIGEATPRTYYPMTQSSTWDNYFQKLFDYIETYDVKMLCYINQDWRLQPIFSDPMWGDSRIQQPGAEFIYNKWKAEMNKPRYVESSAALYQIIGFDPNAPGEAPVVRSPHTIPCTIEATYWDDAFFVYAAPSNDTAAGSYLTQLCWLSSESWMEYDIYSPSGQNASFALRISNGSGEATSATIFLDNANVATVSIPATSDWDTYTTVQSIPVSIPSGTHTMRIQCNGTFNLEWVKVATP